MFRKIGFNFILIVYVWARSPMPDRTTDDFENQCLQIHNSYRAIHNTPALTLDPGVGQIINYAKSRCNYISQYDSLSVGHSGLQLGTYGENLYWGGNTISQPSNASTAIKAWYDEIKYYSWSNPTFSSGTGHFTQIVWKATTKIGCAICAGQGDQWYETYVVCNYVAPGNVMGQFAQNVMPASGMASNAPQKTLTQNYGSIQTQNTITSTTTPTPTDPPLQPPQGSQYVCYYWQ